MSSRLFALIITSVGLSAVAQLLLKAGMSQPRVQAALTAGEPAQTAIAIVSSGQVIAGLGLYALGAAVWLFVLARADVSLAYPFVGLGFILTMALASLLLHEPIGVDRLIGTLLVAVGIYLVSGSTASH